MGISTVRKTKVVRTSDYQIIEVPAFTTTVFSAADKSGRLVSLKVASLLDKQFRVLIDGVAQTSTITFDYNGGVSGVQWISPDLDNFVTAPSACNLSFSNSLTIEIDSPTTTAGVSEIEVDLHVEYDVEVAS